MINIIFVQNTFWIYIMSGITDEDISVCEFIYDNKKDEDYVYGKEFYELK